MWCLPDTAAALVACRLAPRCRDDLFFAHRSAERGHARLLAEVEAEPLLELGLRPGGGSGAVPLLRAACAIRGEKATFADAGVTAAPLAVED